jgi:hypothetical protein
LEEGKITRGRLEMFWKRAKLHEVVLKYF